MQDLLEPAGDVTKSLDEINPRSLSDIKPG